MIATRVFPSSGTVDILGNRLDKVNVFSYRNRIGLVSAQLSRSFPVDEDPLNVVLTALSSTTGRWHERFKKDDYDKARVLMATFRIDYLEGKQMFMLSEGERTRVLICRALMDDPDLLILDEPTTGLDLGGRELVLRTLSGIGRHDIARTVILVTHRLEEIPQEFDHVAIMGLMAGNEADAHADNVTGADPQSGTILYSGDLQHGFTAERLGKIFGLSLKVTMDHGRWTAFVVEGDAA